MTTASHALIETPDRDLLRMTYPRVHRELDCQKLSTMAKDDELEASCEEVSDADLEASGDPMGLVFIFGVSVSITLKGRHSLGL